MSEVCEIYCYDEAKVHRLKQLLSVADTVQAVVLFKALADETRIKIAYVLTAEAEVCVCDVANAIGSTVANVSHHLRLLKNMGLASIRKEGKLVFYSLKDDQLGRLLKHALAAPVHASKVMSSEV